MATSLHINGISFFSGSNETGEIGTWEIDPADDKSIQFRIPSESFGGSEDRIPFYVSSSGRIGIGTKTPSKDFEISGEFKTTKRTTSTGSIIEISYDREGGHNQVGDNMGGIKWNDDNKIGTPGDTAAIYSICTTAASSGSAGDIVFYTTDPTAISSPPREVVRITAAGELSASAYLGPIDGSTVNGGSF